MIKNSSPDAKKEISESLKAFSNLLKEFPKNSSDDFIYDESTIKKIAAAGDALPQLKKHYKKNKPDFIKTLDELMNELPKSASDEFLYDREIHLLVEKARETVNQLS